MTRSANARIAGAAFLAYIAVGITGMIMSRGMNSLAAIAGNEFAVRLGALLTFFCAFMAITLGVTLYALTREIDADLAMFGLVCRVAEGVIGVVAVQRSLDALAMAQVTAPGIDAGSVYSLVSAGDGWTPIIAALLFAVGSTFFCWLFVRGRVIPVPLAWLGMIASVLLLIVLPARILGLVAPPLSEFAWAPMAVFEVGAALWLIAKTHTPMRHAQP